jgi:phosphoribosylformimino-5-aminoimidazole carboxamide ribotide isomerase
LPVTYAGGAKSLDDLERVKVLGSGRVDLTIASALDIFGGGVSYRDVVAWQRREEA